MATLIPALGACVSRMTSGERRLAERLENKLDNDYWLWYDVPMGPRNTHPDFCVMHPPSRHSGAGISGGSVALRRQYACGGWKRNRSRTGFSCGRHADYSKIGHYGT